jgi:hypothetical protein
MGRVHHNNENIDLNRPGTATVDLNIIGHNIIHNSQKAMLNRTEVHPKIKSSGTLTSHPPWRNIVASPTQRTHRGSSLFPFFCCYESHMFRPTTRARPKQRTRGNNCCTVRGTEKASRLSEGRLSEGASSKPSDVICFGDQLFAHGTWAGKPTTCTQRVRS